MSCSGAAADLTRAGGQVAQVLLHLVHVSTWEDSPDLDTALSALDDLAIDLSALADALQTLAADLAMQDATAFASVVQAPSPERERSRTGRSHAALQRVAGQVGTLR